MDWTESLVDHAVVHNRNAVRYLVVRRWRHQDKRHQLESLKSAKRSGCCVTCTTAAADIVRSVEKLFGPLAGFAVSSVPCGHSRTPDCLGKRLAKAVAAGLGLPFVQLFADRFVSGSSHPRQFVNLPPLEWIAEPPGPILLVDDVATSGWHLEESLTAIRARGAAALGVAWIGGSEMQSENSVPAFTRSAIFGRRRQKGAA